MPEIASKTIIHSVEELKDLSHYRESPIHMRNNITLFIHKVIMLVPSIEFSEKFWEDIKDETLKIIYELLPNQRKEKILVFGLMVKRNMVTYGNLGHLIKLIDSDLIQVEMYRILDEFLKTKST
jgi:hypothetical protein